MIDELHIRGLGVIEDVSVRLAPGLTVVTGETGAGKTMLVTALQLLLGARADSALVREGADRALVEAAVFPVPPTAQDWLDAEDETLVVSREIPVDGRSRARVAGRLAPVSALGEVLGSQVEVHAQHEHVRLARPEVQRDLLDRFAGEQHRATLAAYQSAHGRWRALLARRERLDADARERARELDRLGAELAEIETARIDLDRDEHLSVELDRLAHAEALRAAAAAATAALGSEGAQEPIGIAVDQLRRLPVDDPALDALRSRAEGLLAETADLAGELRAYGEAVEADPDHLEELQQRQRVLAGLRRKYGAELAEVLAYAEQARSRLEQIAADEADADALDAQLAEAAQTVRTLGGQLREGRRQAAAALAEIVDAHLEDLGMPHARFSVAVDHLDERAPAAHGIDRIRFLLAANPGEPARPLAQAASGGERSRVSLAIEVALADVDDARVLVFDEVDAGIGGATAMAVGEKLATLARPTAPQAGGTPRDDVEVAGPRQVLCVTHLAQVAAFADVHYVVDKKVRSARTVTSVRPVAEEQRAAELARMLGGDAGGRAGLEHAAALLEAARAAVPR